MKRGILTETLVTLILVRRELNGWIWDTTTGMWLPPTIDSEAAADTAMSEITGATVDLIPFPIEFSLLGLIDINIDRPKMDISLSRILAAVKAYTTATTTSTIATSELSPKME